MSLLARLKTPVFKAEGIPSLKEATYTLKISGLDGPDLSLSLADIDALPQTSVDARLTSVSGWSVRAVWDGVLWRDFMAHLAEHGGPEPGCDVALFRSVGGYDTPVPLTDLDHPRVMLVRGVGGEPLEREYGGPLRLFVPNLWGYKSCKWLAGIEFVAGRPGGFWEDRGYSWEGTIEPGVTLDVNTGTRRAIKGGEVTEF